MISPTDCLTQVQQLAALFTANHLVVVIPWDLVCHFFAQVVQQPNPVFFPKFSIYKLSDPHSVHWHKGGDEFFGVHIQDCMGCQIEKGLWLENRGQLFRLLFLCMGEKVK